MVVILFPVVASAPDALATGGSRSPAATPGTFLTFLGNARHGAPSWTIITIVINAAVTPWTWLLVMLQRRAVVLGGRRCFFRVVLISVDLVVVPFVLMPCVLRSRSPSASSPRGRGRPLGVALPQTRTATRLVGHAPLGEGRRARAPRTCATVYSSSAARTSPTESSCCALTAM